MRTLRDWSLALGMLVTGSANTLTTKYADMQNVKGLDGIKTDFNHPFFQTAGMFLGESLCMLVFLFATMQQRRERRRLLSNHGTERQPLLNDHAASKEDAPTTHATTAKDSKQQPEANKTKKKFQPLLFVLPALCDMTGTSCMYIGLTLTSASIYQMLRGSVVIFTGILSVLFLKNKQYKFHWLGMLLVLVGTILVGVASIIDPDDDDSDSDSSSSTSKTIMGNGLVVFAQVLTAFQMVVEEKFIVAQDVMPIGVVAFEGCFGFTIISCLLVVFYFLPGLDGLSNDSKHFENSLDAFVQLSNSLPLLLATAGSVLSIAFFNWFGVSITQSLSASHRMVLDSVRTMVVWAFDLAVFGTSFAWLQLVGFVVLLAGTIIYNEVVKLPWLYYPSRDGAPLSRQRSNSGADPSLVLLE